MNDSKRCFCQRCGKEFEKKAPNQKYCSIKCQKEMRKVIDRENARQEREASKQPKECPVCGKIFIPNRLHQKYCNGKCMRIMANRRDKNRSRKKKCNNALVIEVTNDADSLGLTYGEYMKSLYKSNGRYA